MATSVEHPTITMIRKYSQRGVLLDTNILLLYVVGQFNPKYIETFKRTNTFIAKDYTLLVQFLSHFRKTVATPHVLTEVSNLAAHLNEPHKGDCFQSFAVDIAALEEHTESAHTIAATPAFTRLGITDASLPLIAQDRFLVVTDDLRLYDHLLRDGVDALNFNHIRLFGW